MRRFVCITMHFNCITSSLIAVNYPCVCSALLLEPTTWLLEPLSTPWQPQNVSSCKLLVLSKVRCDITSSLDSIAASLFVLNWLSSQIVSDDKIQITILILRRGTLSRIVLFSQSALVFVQVFGDATKAKPIKLAEWGLQYFVEHFGTELGTTNRLFPEECEGPHSGGGQHTPNSIEHHHHHVLPIFWGKSNFLPGLRWNVLSFHCVPY